MATDFIDEAEAPDGPVAVTRPPSSHAGTDADGRGWENASVPPSGRSLGVRLLLKTPGATRLTRWAFRSLLDWRRQFRAIRSPLRLRSLQQSQPVSALSWRWYRFRFRFATVRRLRQFAFRVRGPIERSKQTTLSPDQLLLGGWNGLSGYRFAALSGNHLDTSTPLAKSFLRDLLEAYDRDGEASLSDERLQASTYYNRIATAAKLSGHYRGETTPEGLAQVTREYLDRYRGLTVPYRPGRSRPGTLPAVRAIADSDCYQVMDGHHRLAMQTHRGAESLEVCVFPGTTRTYVQQLLLDMSWLDGSRRLYQPVDFPEVQSWTLMRNCRDRLEMMEAYLNRAGLLPASTSTPPTYLDVGSCYGWFVAELGRLGFDARGIEFDPLALELGPLAYGIDASQITIGDAIELLAEPAAGADVVSCFSVLHHFVMGRGTSGPEELIKRLDERTGKVLFLDTGQSHESWFRWTLPEWTPEYTADWIRKHSSFTRVEALGVDRDGVGAFAGKFGRTLFAASRT